MRSSISLLWRALVLLAVLCLIKGLLAVSLDHHFYQVHWRHQKHATTAFNYANYYLFILLVSASVAYWGFASRRYASKTIRGLNLGFIGVGLLFVFFSFHQGYYNYLYPVMCGLLDLADLGAYVKLNLFYGPPYLAGCLALFALLYWILGRTRREHWSFFALGLATAFYLYFNLRELVLHNSELLVVNCFGLAAFASLWLSRRPVPVWQQTTAFLPAVVLWGLFWRFDEDIRRPDAYLVLIISVSLAVFVAASLVARRSEARGNLSHFLPFYFTAFFLFSNRSYPLATNYNTLVVLGLTVSHYVLQEFWLVLAGLGFAGLISWKAPRAGRALFDGLALFLVLASLADFLYLRISGVRVDWFALAEASSFEVAWRVAKPFMWQLGLLTALLGGIYGALVWWRGMSMAAWLQNQIPRDRSNLVFLPVVLLLLALSAPWVLFSDKGTGAAVVRVLASSPLFDWMKPEKMSAGVFARRADDLGMGRFWETGAPKSKSPPRDLNVVMIIMESSYNRYLSLFGAPDETQPLLKKYRDRMELFPNFYANFPNSLNARVTIFSGFYPPREPIPQLQPRLPARCLVEVLHARGFHTSLFQSDNSDYLRFADYIRHRQLDELYDADNMPFRDQYPRVDWGVSEQATLAAMKQQIARHARQRERFFLTYLPVTPHLPYDAPSKQFEVFKENPNPTLSKDLTGRYKNQLLYMDWILTSLLDALADARLLEDTLVLITNDHGEMVGEDDGHLGHGWNLDPKLCNIPLIIMDPRSTGYRVNYALGSQIDIFPTVLDLLNLEMPVRNLVQGRSLFANDLGTNRVIYLQSHRHRALVRGTQFVLEDPHQKTADGRNFTRAFTIRNDGTRTLFDQAKAPVEVTAQLDAFQRFQYSFIVHYTHYQQVLGGASP